VISRPPLVSLWARWSPSRLAGEAWPSDPTHRRPRRHSCDGRQIPRHSDNRISAHRSDHQCVDRGAVCAEEPGCQSTADLDLIGEIKHSAAPARVFQRGVTSYPAIGDPVLAIGARELRLVYNECRWLRDRHRSLQQDSSITAYVDLDDMLSKHFAVLGTTGVGKSSAVVLLLHEIVRTQPNLRIFVLDAHNEYGRPFADKALVLNPRNLRLPFWLFNFDEMVDVLFGARPGTGEEVDILSEAIPRAKANYGTHRAGLDRSIVKKNEPRAAGYSIDTPVPIVLPISLRFWMNGWANSRTAPRA
jgi:hypothetical protein